MNDETILVGDLVIVVRGNECCGHHVGRVFKVGGIVPWTHWLPHTQWECRGCGHAGEFDPYQNGVAYLSQENKWLGFGRHRLKKIPPLTEPEHMDEEITA